MGIKFHEKEEITKEEKKKTMRLSEIVFLVFFSPSTPHLLSSPHLPLTVT